MERGLNEKIVEVRLFFVFSLSFIYLFISFFLCAGARAQAQSVHIARVGTSSTVMML